MKKIVLTAMLCATVYAQSFESFLEVAIQKSPYLKAQSLQIEQSKQRASAITRYENPSLALEGSYFTPDGGDGSSGYRAGIVQPLRLWGVSDDRDELAKATIALNEAQYKRELALFVRDISLQYVNYVERSKRLELAKQELEIAKSIYDISQARFDLGTITRGALLQAKIDYNMIRSRLQSQKILAKRAYFMLLKTSGITQEISLELEHTFTLKRAQDALNPELLTLQKKEQSAMASSKLNANKIEWMDIAGEYEREPNQDIVRFSADIPLAIFNTKSQEKRIATLEAKRSELLQDNASLAIDMELKRLRFELERLNELQAIDREILQDEQSLLQMYEQGYKIANINLLALQDAKARLIETKERLITIESERNKNIILQNYLQGSYNE